MLTPRCEILLRRLREIPELAVPPDSLPVMPCPDGIVQQCRESDYAISARWLRKFLEEPDAALMLSIYRIEKPYVAYAIPDRNVVFGVDHEGPYRMSLVGMCRQTISPEELFVSAPEGVAFGLWDAFATHIEGAVQAFLRRCYPDRF